MSDKIIEAIGEPALLEQFAEECAELAHALLKLARIRRGENPTPVTEEEAIRNVHEELADVENCLTVLWNTTDWFDMDLCVTMEKKKMKRWAERVEEKACMK